MATLIRTYRTKLRAWRRAVELRRELKFYDGAFESIRLKVPDEEEIRNAIKSKFPQTRPKTKGALDIVAIYHHYDWENDSLAPSLEKFGSVRHYDWLEGFPAEEKGWHRFVRQKMNDDLLQRLQRWVKEDSTDVVFAYVSGAIISPATAKSMAQLNVPIINMSLNDKEAFVGRIRNGRAMGVRDICRYFDLSWTSTEDAVKKYCVEGAFPVCLPEGANPEIHKPYTLEKDVDVSFVGQCYGNRPEIIRKIEGKGIRVEAYGRGWPRGSLTTQEMVRLYSRSKINLGFGGVAGCKGTYCLKGRDFEIPMSGGLYVTEYNDEMARCYDLDKEIVTYRDLDDLVEKIRDLLVNPRKADEIRKRGFQRARKEHTWEMRFEKIFRLMGLI